MVHNYFGERRIKLEEYDIKISIDSEIKRHHDFTRIDKDKYIALNIIDFKNDNNLITQKVWACPKLFLFLYCNNNLYSIV